MGGQGFQDQQDNQFVEDIMCCQGVGCWFIIYVEYFRCENGDEFDKQVVGYG